MQKAAHIYIETPVDANKISLLACLLDTRKFKKIVMSRPAYGALSVTLTFDLLTSK